MQPDLYIDEERQTSAHVNQDRKAGLLGSVTEPKIAVRFPYDATHEATGQPLLEWVKAQPARRWNAAQRRWEIFTFEAAMPEIELAAAGLPLVVNFLEPETISTLTRPLAVAHQSREHVRVWPRFHGYHLTSELLDGRGEWVGGKGHFLVPAHALPIVGIDHADGVDELLAELTERSDELTGGAARLAASRSVDQVEHATDVQAVLNEVGEIPDWFGLDLFPFQRAGAIAVAAGHRLLSDEPGLGKTRQSLAAAALLDARRIVITCPPVVLTSWVQAVEESRLADSDRFIDGPVPDGDGAVVSIRPGRKEPDLPAWGVVVVSDSLVTARPPLLDRLCDWQADVVIGDEIHRAKTWTAKRSKALRTLAKSSKTAIGISGTPMYAAPPELTGPLAFTGDLDRTFGGWKSFMAEFCFKDRFKVWRPRTDKLGDLKVRLDQQVWVRRVKSQVLPDLPPKLRSTKIVDVDLKGFRDAHRDVVAKIDEWLDHWVKATGRLPHEDQVRDWVIENLGMVSQLRRAAGLAKVDVATEMIAEWVETHGCDRPMIVWTHHKEVTAAMAEAVPEAVAEAEIIDGSTSHRDRERIVEAFQAGQVPVIVCSIHAAGVGITLTRSSDVLFVESDWTPSLVSQAEDRASRIGQANKVLITTLIAPNTLDEHIQRVLSRKIAILDEVMTGADHGVVAGDATAGDAPHEIVMNLVMEQILKRESNRRAA